MPRGEQTTYGQWRQALKLLKESYREGSEVRRSRIPAMCGMSARTFCRIRDQAAIHWYDDVLHAEHISDVRDRCHDE